MSSSFGMQIDKDGSLWSWGSAMSPLGLGATGAVLSPTKVSGCGWVKVVVGVSHAIGLKGDGSLWGWGDNTGGQLGNGSTAAINLPPQRLGSETDWADVAAGAYYTMAIKKNGTLWAWGDDSDGQLGDGHGGTAGTYVTSPKQIGTDTNWKTVSANSTGSVSAAIKTDGSLWAWGNNSTGQVGNGGTGGQICSSDAVAIYCVYTPTQIGGTTTWASVAAGNQAALAISTSGELWAWGSDNDGALGDGSNSNSQCPDGETLCALVPQQVGTGTNWASVAASAAFAVGVQKDGSLWAWGNNQEGSLGDGTAAGSLCTYGEGNYCVGSPERIGTDTDWSAVWAGGWTVFGLRSDGTVWTWGDNSMDEAGIGSTTPAQENAPVQIP